MTGTPRVSIRWNKSVWFFPCYWLSNVILPGSTPATSPRGREVVASQGWRGAASVVRKDLWTGANAAYVTCRWRLLRMTRVAYSAVWGRLGAKASGSTFSIRELWFVRLLSNMMFPNGVILTNSKVRFDWMIVNVEHWINSTKICTRIVWRELSACNSA